MKYTYLIKELTYIDQFSCLQCDCHCKETNVGEMISNVLQRSEYGKKIKSHLSTQEEMHVSPNSK